MQTQKKQVLGYCLTNYTIQCVDKTSGETGCFLFDTVRYANGEGFHAISPVCKDLVEFYAWCNANGNPNRPAYIERVN